MATLTATVFPDEAFVLVELSWVGATTATIVRVDPDGSRTPVRNGEDATVTSDALALEDHEVALDVEVTYEATSDLGGTTTSNAVTVDSNGLTWLKHPGQPALNATVRLASKPTETEPITQGVYPVYGARYPVVTSMPRMAPTGEVAFRIRDAADRNNLAALLLSGDALLLQTPGTWEWGSRYIALGDANRDWLTRLGDDVRAVLRAPYHQVARPVGLSSGAAIGTSWDDLVAAGTTWDDLVAAGTTWNQLAGGA